MTAELATAIDPDVAGLSDAVVRFMRSAGRARAKMLAAAVHDVEWSAHVLLKCLDSEGAMRAGSLAECVSSDPSTVSRQVASLVKLGLLERRADPDDGRASLLVVTDRGKAVLAEHDRIRLVFFADMISDWDASDVQTFTRLLERFTDDYNQIDHERVREQISASTRRPEGSN